MIKTQIKLSKVFVEEFVLELNGISKNREDLKINKEYFTLEKQKKIILMQVL